MRIPDNVFEKSIYVNKLDKEKHSLHRVQRKKTVQMEVLSLYLSFLTICGTLGRTLIFLQVMLLCASSSGNPSPTLISGEKRISLQCLHNYMLLDMDLQDIPGLEPASLHLRHFSCKPYQVLDTRAIFRVPFQGCGTTRESNSDYIVYENVVDNSKESNTTRVLIRHAQELRYPFSCRYRQKYFLILQEGQSGKRRENEIDRGNGNSTKEKVFPEEVKRPTSSVSHVLLQKYLGIFLFGMHLLFSS